MSFFNVILENQDITVLGPPNEIDVNIDIGAKGDRGARFFSGSGDPNDPGVIPVGENIQLGDVFVNSSTAARYGWLYIYLRTPSGNSWVPTLKLQPAIYVEKRTALFTNGNTSISIPIRNISPGGVVTNIARYTILLNINHPNPTAFSITAQDVNGPNLVFSIRALEFVSSTWQNLAGNVELALNISVV
jgi:hypothetical protein